MLLHINLPSLVGPDTTDDEIFGLDEIIAYKEAQKVAMIKTPMSDPVIVMSTHINEICLQILLHLDSLHGEGPSLVNLSPAFEALSSDDDPSCLNNGL